MNLTLACHTSSDINTNGHPVVFKNCITLLGKNPQHELNIYSAVCKPYAIVCWHVSQFFFCFDDKSFSEQLFSSDLKRKAVITFLYTQKECDDPGI